MSAFPIERLIPLPGTIAGMKGKVSITIPIQPFELIIEGEKSVVDTSLQLDVIKLPSTDFSELSGRAFSFPKNPKDGYIDGSIYIDHAHHPADVTRISFGPILPAGIAVEMDVDFCFEFEGLGDFENARWVVASTLSGDAADH
jgi:hypothetical protein